MVGDPLPSMLLLHVEKQILHASAQAAAFYLMCATQEGDTFIAEMTRGKTLEDSDIEKER